MLSSTETTLVPMLEPSIMSRRGGPKMNLSLSPVTQDTPPANLRNLPRRAKKKVVPRPTGSLPKLPSFTASTPTPSLPVPRPGKEKQTRCMQEVTPGLYIAFSDEELFPAGDCPSDFSHYVHIMESTSSSRAVNHYSNSSSQTLVLAVSHTIPDHGQSRLVAEQLSAARDFLAGALPPRVKDFGSNQYPPYTASSSTPSLLDLSSNTPEPLYSSLPTTPSEPRMLITCPRASPVDAMSVAACFLSSTSGETVHEVIMRFNDGSCSPVINHAAQRRVALDTVFAQTHEKLAEESTAELLNTLTIVEDALHLKDEAQLSVHERRRLKREQDLQMDQEALGMTIGPKRGTGLVPRPRATTGLGIAGIQFDESDHDAWRGCVSLDGMDFIDSVVVAKA